MHLYRNQNGDFLASAEKIDLRVEDSNLKYSREIEVLQDTKLLAKLSPNHREIIIARNEGFSYKEISEKFEISMGTVMSRLFWAKRKLEKFNGEKYKTQRAKSATYEKKIQGFNK